MVTDSPYTGITQYSYDPAGNLRFKVQNDKTIEYRYDALSRLTHILYNDSAQNVTMTYDTAAGSVGRLATVTDPSGHVEYSYDDHGHIEMETRTVNGVAFVTGYGYDTAGNLRTITYPTGHTIDYQPDTNDPALIAGVTLDNSEPLATGITYTPFGPVKTLTLANGIQTVKTYDKNYQLRTTTAGTAMNRTYTPDAVGNITQITNNLDPSRSQSFAYDALYRLTNATGLYGTVAFTYDKVGNRLTRIQTGTSPSENTYHYQPGTNRLGTVEGTQAERIQYDGDGNITVRTPGAGNPVPVITNPADYTYNSNGQRAVKDATTDKIFHYDLAGQLIAETDGQGTLIKIYVWLHGQPLAQIAAGGQVHYYHNDHLGTPQKMTDGSANVVWAADYLPFGKADVTIGSVENNLRFAGQYYDSETGLHYNYHRYYDPKLGRYLRADPIGLEGGINPKIYVQNNPLNHIDPSGLKIYLQTGNNVKIPGTNIKNPVQDMAHQDICVDTWKECCPEDPSSSIKSGKKCFSFAAIGLGFYDSNDWFGEKNPHTSFIEGQIYESEYTEGRIEGTVNSDCYQDLEFFVFLSSRVGEKAGYSLGRHNCRKFSQMMFEEAKRRYGTK